MTSTRARGPRQAAGGANSPLAAHFSTNVILSAAQLVALLACCASAAVGPQKLVISSAGINVPSRPKIIAGLNQQFTRATKLQSAMANSTAAAGSSGPAKVGGLLAAALVSGPFGLGSGQLAGRNKLQSQQQSQQQQQLQSQSPQTQVQANGSSPSGLYLDRHQQELLAANPNIPLSNSNLLTRSDAPSAASGPSQPGGGAASGAANLIMAIDQPAPPTGQRQPLGAFSQSATTNQQQPASQADAHPNQQQQAAAQQQSYRGYSLIELEVKSEPDRRYVQELYGNLSAALNEQAQRPNSFASVSPYVDIDFWSFKCALNDQIDIMVSPKSRAFILNQLARARIKHRVKIDDIQSRLEAQAPGLSPSSSSSGNGELSGRQSADANQSAKPKQFGADQQQQQQLNGRQQPNVLNQQQVGGPSARPDPFAGTANMNDSLFFENYQRLAEINQYLESVVARARDIARVQVIGRSSQGRYLRVLRLGYEQADLDGTTGPLMNGRADAIDANEGGVAEARNPQQADADQMLAAKLQQPLVQNASTIVENFFRRQQAVKKLGSIWLDGGTHAREWISPATVLYMSFRLADNHARCLRFFDHLHMVVNQQAQQQFTARSAGRQAQLDSDLLNGINEINTSLLGAGSAGAYAKARPRTEFEQKLEILAKRPQEVASEHACDLELEQLLRRYTFYIMPVLNPDGYEYSHTHNRLWRKTRSTSSHPIYRHFCLGADPNRNYDARHGSTGSSSHPCSQTYGGTTPFTEPETRHQSNFVYSHRDTLKMFISFHSYSQMILLPFSHSKQLAPDHKDLESVGQAAVKAIERTHGTQYRVGPSASILYTASGTASDWAYEKAGIKYSYTIELRDTGTYGFLLPRQQIIPTGEETFNGLLAMIGQMEKNDNLLTSKSNQVALALQAQAQAAASAMGANGHNGQRNGTAAAHSGSSGDASTAGFVHAPDLDQLRPFGRFRPKPAQLENALDGSDTWATPEPRPPGVRDRPPAGGQSGNRVIEDEVVSMSEEEPDAGLAFEGEGELMEPTNNLSVESTLAGQSSDAAAESAAKLMGHIYAHTSSAEVANGATAILHDRTASELLGRQMSTAGSSSAAAAARQRFANNQLGLSANGRSLINSPPAPARTTTGRPRRESSNEFAS